MPITIELPEVEGFDEATSRFVTQPAVRLTFEHSLVSLSKWESQFKKPFLKKEEKSAEEIYAYLQHMCQEDVDLSTLYRFTQAEMNKINAYIDDAMTATWFTERPGQKPNREIVTAELIYHWMFALNAPKDLENWHLNRLFTQLRVINEKNQPPKKMSKAEALAQHRAINARNKAAMNTSG